MQRSLSVTQVKTNQFIISLPIDWVRATRTKKKDLLMMFSPDYYKSPLVIVTQKEYMKNPEIRKIVDQIIELMEKGEGVI